MGTTIITVDQKAQNGNVVFGSGPLDPPLLPTSRVYRIGSHGDATATAWQYKCLPLDVTGGPAVPLDRALTARYS